MFGLKKVDANDFNCVLWAQAFRMAEVVILHRLSHFQVSHPNGFFG